MSKRSSQLGVGLGLRAPHYSYILENLPKIGWFEAISENYMGLNGSGLGRPIRTLEKIRSNYPVVLHGVSLSIGSTDELDFQYLRQLKALIDRIEPEWVSDHLCWTGVSGENIHDLLPLPYTEDALEWVSARISRVQEFLGKPIALENVSAYLSFNHSEMNEWDFIAEIARRTGCGILLDINNVYVSSKNQSFDPVKYLDSLRPESVVQMHLAGHSQSKVGLIDTHDGVVSDSVWDLFRYAASRFNETPTLIEWDAKIPNFEVLYGEAKKAEIILRENAQ